jgi:glyoxylase-like metal-dependent hydrolase (beta-lactamase superfamily II)
MKSFSATSAVCAILLAACSHPHPVTVPVQASVLESSWYAGDSSCVGRRTVEARELNPDFYVLRQAACTNYEKPFMYLLFGKKSALLFDTGAGNVNIVSPIDTLIVHWLRTHHRKSTTLIVAHRHSHGDHIAGDKQLATKPNTTVVGTDTAAVRKFFGIQNWPADTAIIDLGDRVIDVLPIPGHQAASIALYDRRTGIMLTGDTFYPGRLYVRDTAAFANSIARLASFARTHPVTHLLGAHIEQTNKPFTDYPVGTVNQPEEHMLDLRKEVLFELDSVVNTMRGRFVRKRLADLTIWPQ